MDAPRETLMHMTRDNFAAGIVLVALQAGDVPAEEMPRLLEESCHAHHRMMVSKLRMTSLVDSLSQELDGDGPHRTPRRDPSDDIQLRLEAAQASLASSKAQVAVLTGILKSIAERIDTLPNQMNRILCHSLEESMDRESKLVVQDSARQRLLERIASHPETTPAVHAIANTHILRTV